MRVTSICFKELYRKLFLLRHGVETSSTINILMWSAANTRSVGGAMKHGKPAFLFVEGTGGRTDRFGKFLHKHASGCMELLHQDGPAEERVFGFEGRRRAKPLLCYDNLADFISELETRGCGDYAQKARVAQEQWKAKYPDGIVVEEDPVLQEQLLRDIEERRLKRLAKTLEASKAEESQPESDGEPSTISKNGTEEKGDGLAQQAASVDPSVEEIEEVRKQE